MAASTALQLIPHCVAIVCGFVKHSSTHKGLYVLWENPNNETDRIERERERFREAAVRTKVLRGRE